MPSSPRKRRWVLPAITAVVACLAALAVGVAGGKSLAAAENQISVGVAVGGSTEAVAQLDNVRMFKVPPDQTVTSVLITAGVVPRPGRLLSVKTHKVLDPAIDPPTITVDGRPARDDTPVADGSTVQVIAGQDAVERTVAVNAPIPAPVLPDVLRHVHLRGKPGVAAVVKGARSGEILGKKVLRKPTSPRAAQGRVVALTFDDGPTPTWTPMLLQILADKGVKATFCEVGTFVRYHPELTRRIVAEGHQLCNHSLDHDERLPSASPAHLEDEIGGADKVFEEAGVAAPRYFRAPGGNVNDAVLASARKHGKETLGWKVDTEDWRRGATTQQIIATAMAQADNGAIVLMHDGGGTSRTATMAAVGPLIDQLRAAGYTFTFPVVG